LNLLNNAIDALTESGHPKPELRIRGKASGHSLELEVEDNGKGIEPERADDVFSLFKTSKSQGIGGGPVAQPFHRRDARRSPDVPIRAWTPYGFHFAFTLVGSWLMGECGQPREKKVRNDGSCGV